MCFILKIRVGVAQTQISIQSFDSLRATDEPYRRLTGLVFPLVRTADRNSRSIPFQKLSPSSLTILRASQANSHKLMKMAIPRPQTRTTKTPPTLANPSSLAAELPPPSSCNEYVFVQFLIDVKFCITRFYFAGPSTSFLFPPSALQDQ